MSLPLGPRIARCRIRQNAGGTALLDFLVERFTYHTREAWLAALAASRVLRNGEPATGHEQLAEGDTIEYRCGDLPEPPVPHEFQIVHAEDDLLVIAKPPGLPVHPAGRYFAHTLWAFLREEGHADLHFLTRLDRETSGLLLAARTPAAAKHFQGLASQGRIAKTYLAAVEGEFPETLHASGWLHRDATSTIRKKRRFSPLQPHVPGEQTVETHFACLARRQGLSLLQAELITGRTHQIRATLCSLGFPVVGDKIYGRDETWFLRFRDGTLTEDDERALRLPHQALHSWRLSSPPSTAMAQQWTCPPPADFAALFPGTT